MSFEKDEKLNRHDDTAEGVSAEDQNRLTQSEVDIASGEHLPETDHQLQMKLATELYKIIHKDEEINLYSHDTRNDIMFTWAEGGENSYSKAYRRITEDSGFAEHPRLKGNIFNITLDDIIYYRDNGNLPAK